jgi:hypothetical protein
VALYGFLGDFDLAEEAAQEAFAAAAERWPGEGTRRVRQSFVSRLFITALRSRIGVPSIASKARTRSCVGASMAVTVTRCRPMGFGRSDDRVAKTPSAGYSDRRAGASARRFDPLGEAR